MADEKEGMGLIVISFPIPKNDPGIELFRDKMQAVKPLFTDTPEVRVYGATRETADLILTLLSQEVEKKE